MDIKEALKLVQRPQYYNHYGDKKFFNTWSLGEVIKNRGSDLRERSNYKEIKMRLEAAYPSSMEDCPWEISHCSHCLVGWVKHLSFQVFTDETKTKIHPIVNFIKDLFQEIQDHIILNEDDFYERENEERFEIFVQECKHWLDNQDVNYDDDFICNLYEYCMRNETVTIEENHWDISEESLEEARVEIIH